MSKRTSKILIIGLLTIGVFSVGYYRMNKLFKFDSCLEKGGYWNFETGECEFNKTVELVNHSDTLDKLQGYNELADEDDRKVYTISEYNTDLSDIGNIQRPERTQIIDPTIDTLLLLRIWTLDPDGPHADFWIKKECFFVVDYDGDGCMPYLLKRDSLTIYYNDFIQKGIIFKVTKDSLTIRLDDTDSPTDYVEWRN